MAYSALVCISNYNVAVYGTDYDPAATDAGLKVASLLHQCVIPQLLMANAMCGGPLSGFMASFATRLHHHYLVTLYLWRCRSRSPSVPRPNRRWDRCLQCLERFVQLNPQLVKQIDELCRETVEMNAVGNKHKSLASRTSRLTNQHESLVEPVHINIKTAQHAGKIYFFS